jgi:hypothetical protein
VKIIKSKTCRTGFAVSLKFSLTQHLRDTELMEKIRNTFWPSCGKFEKPKTESKVVFVLTALLDVDKKVIQFFQRYPLQGSKRLDFEDFCKVTELMKKKAHLTQEGLDQIRKIKSEMNRGRDHEKTR